MPKIEVVVVWGRENEAFSSHFALLLMKSRSAICRCVIRSVRYLTLLKAEFFQIIVPESTT